MFISLENDAGREGIRELLLDGAVVGIPTDTVWGLACLAEKLDAVGRIFEIKNRPRDATLPLFVPEPESVWDYSDRAACSEKHVSRILDKFTPGPLTLVLPVREGALGRHLLHTDGTAAFRIPDFPALRELLESLPGPLAATSLNRHRHEPLRGLRMVSRLYEPLLDAIAVHPAAPLNQRVSTVMGFHEGTPTVYREGAISTSRLQAALG
jgi:L-threonylcarbamoyladenylate synthase